MIAGVLHSGSGLGNMLHRYVATRVLAEDKGYEWGMMNPHLFKGKDFMQLDMGKYFDPFAPWTEWQEKKVVENAIDIRSYDPEINFVGDKTVIDGEFQDPRYFEHRLTDVNSWLEVVPLEVPDTTCVIGFRGGEFAVFPDLFLPRSYWMEAMEGMAAMGITDFEVHTDDPATAQAVFPGFKVIHDIGINWRSMRHAKHAIIANSSFYILPRLLSGGITIAPRYWARRNIGVWALPQNYYKSFQYI